MAIQHISINRNSPQGDALRQGLLALENAIVTLRDVISSMPFMVDTTPDPDDYSYLETQFGFPTGKGATAKAELETLMAKIDTNNAVSGVKDTIQQIFNIFAS